MDTRGVTVTFLRTFVHDNQAKLQGMTTTDVCNQMIKPQTEYWGISYLELLERRGDFNSFGQATHFASHAWSYSFLAFVGTIFQKCEEDGLNEERAWCLFELWAIVEGQVPFEIVLPAEEKKSFTTFLVEGGKVENVISEIDIRKARAYKPSDLENIKRIVDKSMGHGKLNELLTAEMRQWFVSTAESALLMIPEKNRTVSELYLNIMKMYLMLGRYSEAETGLVARGINQLELLGTNDIKLAETMCELGGSKLYLGQLESALEVLSEALQICRMAEVENLELLGKVTTRLGSVKSGQGKYSEALQMYQESLDIRTRCFGTGHVSVATTLMNIGNVLRELGDYESALVEYQKALDIQIQSLGEAHVSVAVTYLNMGSCVAKMGRYEEARDYYQKCLEINQKCLGDQHISTANAKSGLALIFSHLGELEKALKLHEEVLETQVRCLGTGHVRVADTYCNMGFVYEKLGNFHKALEVYEKDLEITKMSLGDSHMSVAITKENIALVYIQLGQCDKAKILYQEAHEVFLRSLGPTHFITLRAARGLLQL